MRTIVKILDVELQGTKKGDMAVITVKSPGAREALTLRMFPGDVEENKHQPFVTNVGREMVTDIDAEIYNGQLQHRFSFGFIAVPFESFIQHQASKLKPAPAPGQQQKAS